MKVVTWSRYIGCFVGNWESETTWLDDKVQGWTDSVRTLYGGVCKHLQLDYAGLQNSLQQEWEFVQQVTPDTGRPSDQ